MGKTQKVQLKSIASGKYLQFNESGVLHANGGDQCYLLQAKDGDKYQFMNPENKEQKVALDNDGHPEKQIVEEHTYFTLVPQGRENVVSLRNTVFDFFVAFDNHGNWVHCKDSDDSENGKFELTRFDQ